MVCQILTIAWWIVIIIVWAIPLLIAFGGGRRSHSGIEIIFGFFFGLFITLPVTIIATTAFNMICCGNNPLQNVSNEEVENALLPD